jgi:aerobic C4-dicarboxylate transport protein
VATIVVARWEGELDQSKFAAAMAGQLPEEADLALSGGLQPA